MQQILVINLGHDPREVAAAAARGEIMNFNAKVLLVLMLGLAGCLQSNDGAGRGTASVPSENTGARVAKGQKLILHAQYDVQQVNVVVPQTLVVSEANSYRPRADIVWRGDPVGDRHQQIKAIFTDAMAQGTATMHNGPKVVLDIEVTRFHGVTEKTRYSIGGMHNMRFVLTVRDAGTGAVLQGPRLVIAEVKAAGGAKAVAEDAAGRTQKVVVTERLAQAIRRELSAAVAQ